VHETKDSSFLISQCALGVCPPLCSSSTSSTMVTGLTPVGLPHTCRPAPLSHPSIATAQAAVPSTGILLRLTIPVHARYPALRSCSKGSRAVPGTTVLQWLSSGTRFRICSIQKCSDHRANANKIGHLPACTVAHFSSKFLCYPQLGRHLVGAGDQAFFVSCNVTAGLDVGIMCVFVPVLGCTYDVDSSCPGGKRA